MRFAFGVCEALVAEAVVAGLPSRSSAGRKAGASHAGPVRADVDVAHQYLELYVDGSLSMR